MIGPNTSTGFQSPEQGRALKDSFCQKERARNGRYVWPFWDGATYPPLFDSRQQRRARERAAAKKERRCG